jgi:hypothetical protein
LLRSALIFRRLWETKELPRGGAPLRHGRGRLGSDSILVVRPRTGNRGGAVFRHGNNAEGNVLTRCKLKRRYVVTFFEKLQPCLVGIEACATSHHWSRELKALGHTVHRSPAYAKPYVKRRTMPLVPKPSVSRLRSPSSGASRVGTYGVSVQLSALV